MKKIASIVVLFSLLVGIVIISPTTLVYASNVNDLYNIKTSRELVPTGSSNMSLADLQQYLNGWNVSIDASAANVNGDSNINMKDIVLLQQYLNGWSVELK